MWKWHNKRKELAKNFNVSTVGKSTFSGNFGFWSIISRKCSKRMGMPTLYGGGLGRRMLAVASITTTVRERYSRPLQQWPRPASPIAAASETEACVSARLGLAAANDRDRDLGSRVTEPEPGGSRSARTATVTISEPEDLDSGFILPWLTVTRTLHGL